MAVRPLAFARGAAVFLAAALFVSCQDRRPIVIGLAGSFSGREASFGVSGRRAALLFARDLNAAGGIGGRPLRFVIGDFESDPDRVVEVDRDLLEKGAIAIVGHFTSTMALAATGFADRERVALVSPSASSDKLSGKDDFFFRTVMCSEGDAAALAANMRERGLGRLLVIETSANRAYAETYTKPLAKLVEIAGDIAFDKVDEVDYAKALRSRADSVLIIANSVDAGTIAQGLRVRGFSAQLYLSGYSATNGEMVAESGGKAVEGAWLVHQVDESLPELAPFKAEYEKAYGIKPDFEALETLDALCLVKAALQAGGLDRESFYRAIRAIRSFQSASGKLTMDSFGDIQRPLFARTIVGGKIVVLGRVK